MAILKNAFNKINASANSAASSLSTSSSSYDESSLSMGDNAMRWDKALAGADAIVTQVSAFDPDGVDVVVVGGGLAEIEPIFEDFAEAKAACKCPNKDLDCKIEWFRKSKTTKGLEAKLASKDPVGPCPMGRAVSNVLTEALEEKDCLGNGGRPVSVLVLTAGKIDDTDLLEEALQSAAQKVKDTGVDQDEKLPLSVTFVQIGKDKEAAQYLKYLDKKMTAKDCDGEIDIVDVMSYDEIKYNLDEMSEEVQKSKKKGSNGKNGAIIGAFAGAAIGVGATYMYSKKQEKKRVTSGSWGGQWKCIYEEEEIAILDVEDDQVGGLVIEGLQDTLEGSYWTEEQCGDEFWIKFTDPCGEVIEGEFDEENFIITWSDGTRWEALNKQMHWAKYAGAGAAGAALLGGAGYMVDKKFFSKVQKQDQRDYIVVIDRSAAMALTEMKKKKTVNKCEMKKKTINKCEMKKKTVNKCEMKKKPIKKCGC